MSLNDVINTIHHYISGDVCSTSGRISKGLWDIFSLVNGNPENANYGVRLTLMLFLSLFLIAVLHIRTKLIFDKKHLVAYIGSLFLVFRILTMLCFEWGWQVGIYDDWMLHLLSPPLEHFWNMLFFGCMGYYTLNIYDYYPGILKKILWLIPTSIMGFFIYSTVTWKTYFLTKLPDISKYNQCASDWQNHLVIAIIALYIVIVAIHKYKKYHMFLSAFWTLTFIEHFIRFIAFYNGYEPPELATIFHAMATWSLPLLILHFINAYIIRFDIPRERRMSIKHDKSELFIRCDDCLKPTLEIENV